MDFKQIETFLCVFEEGNVTRAAAKLNIVQPAVSNQLKKLEASLKLELFDRTSRGITPTASGRALYRLFAPIMESFRTAEHQADALGDHQVQEISVGLNPFAGDAIMSDVLQTFRIRYPEIGVHVEEELSNTLLRRVADGALDLAIIHFGNQSVGIPATVVAVPLAEEELVFVTKRGDLQASSGPLRFVDVAAQPLVLPKSRMGFRRDLEYIAAQAHTALRVELEINAPGPLMDLVAHGSLAAVVPESTARKAMRRLPVYFRRIIEPTLVRSILYVHRRDRPLTPALTQFVSIVGATIHSALGRSNPQEDGA